MFVYILAFAFVQYTSATFTEDGNKVVIDKTDFSKLLDRLSSLENLVFEQQQEIGTLKTAVKKFENEESAGHKKINKRHTQGEVAFYSYVERSNLLHQAIHQNIVFETAMLNIGHGYETVNGTFTAPVYGLYLITSSLLSERDKEIWADVVVSGRVVAKINGRGTDGRHGSGSQTVIVVLLKGDQVSIQNLYPDDAYWGDRYCTFGGFLITEFPEITPDVIG